MCHVLIIEDDVIVAASIQLLLAEHGLTSAEFASTELEAVGAARQRLPKVITSDVNLKKGTGPHAVKAIIAEHGPIPVIYITASPEACKDCPAEHVFAKPMDEDRVAALFRVFSGST